MTFSELNCLILSILYFFIIIFSCNCPSGYTGPRCELLTLTFNPTSNSHTYALFNPFVLCAPTRIELEFTTTGQRGLLFFNGAIDREARYFISAQFVNNTTIIVNVGSTNILQINNLVINDKYWHKLDITIDENVNFESKFKNFNIYSFVK
jgi:hypothetical protein